MWIFIVYEPQILSLRHSMQTPRFFLKLPFFVSTSYKIYRAFHQKCQTLNRYISATTGANHPKFCIHIEKIWKLCLVFSNFMFFLRKTRYKTLSQMPKIYEFAYLTPCKGDAPSHCTNSASNWF